MEINVHVKPNSKIPLITKTGTFSFDVKVDVPATENKANVRLIQILSDYFGVSKSSIRIIHGLRGKNKVVLISDL